MWMRMSGLAGTPVLAGSDVGSALGEGEGRIDWIGSIDGSASAVGVGLELAVHPTMKKTVIPNQI